MQSDHVAKAPNDSEIGEKLRDESDELRLALPHYVCGLYILDG